MKLDLASILAIVLFIIPGYLAQNIPSALKQKYYPINDLDVILRSLIHSGIIYSAFYPVYWGVFDSFPTLHFSPTINVGVKDHVISTIIIIFALTVFWGLMLYFNDQYQLVRRCLALIKINPQVQPPNLWASVFDVNYIDQTEFVNKGIWVYFPHNGTIKEGYVDTADVSANERTILVKEIKEVDENYNVLKEYNEAFSIPVDLNKLPWIEVFTVTEPKGSKRKCQLAVDMLKLNPR